jgi:hypothetical protein
MGYDYADFGTDNVNGYRVSYHHVRLDLVNDDNRSELQVVFP